MARTYDIALLGATGEAGRQLAEAFCRADNGGLRLLLVGRDAVRLRALAARLPGCPDHEVVRADASGALEAVARSARLMVSAAGPFAAVGDAPVAASLRAGTDYLDLCAEVPWLHTLVQRHHDAACDAGVQIVPACGFDAVPSDLACLTAARALQAAGSEPLRIDVLFALRGRLPRGTVRTARSLFRDPRARAALADPRLLCPSGARGITEDEHDLSRPRWHAPTRRWLTPFLLSRTNTRIVRRSAALLDAQHAGYGERLVYREGLRTSTPTRAWLTTLAQRQIERALIADGRRAALLERLADPRIGPHEGFVSAAIWGRGHDGTEVRGVLSTPGDPTREASIVYAREAALALLEGGRDPSRMVGVLTPATAVGAPLADRLRATGTTLELHAS